MDYRLVTAPAAEPISLQDARLHLNLTVIGGVHPHDSLITRLIKTARTYAEQVTGLAIGLQTREVALTDWADTIPLPGGYVKDIVSVKYTTASGVAGTVLSPTFYRLEPVDALLYRAFDQTWPDYRADPNAILVQYRTGEALLPDNVLSAMYLLITHLYENRGETTGFQTFSIPMGIDELLTTSRINMGV